MSALWRVLVQNAAGNRGTPIDWCEANYAVSPHVAEFYNTASSACYVVAGLSCLRRARAHAPLRRDGHFTLAAIAIILTGVFSAWFHATLTWRSQKADEAAENAALVLLMRASQGLPCGPPSAISRNQHHMPHGGHENRPFGGSNSACVHFCGSAGFFLIRTRFGKEFPILLR